MTSKLFYLPTHTVLEKEATRHMIQNPRVSKAHSKGNYAQALAFAQKALSKQVAGSREELRAMFDVAYCMESVDKAKALQVWERLFEFGTQGTRDVSPIDFDYVKNAYASMLVHQGLVLQDKELQLKGSTLLNSMHGASLPVIDQAKKIVGTNNVAFSLASGDDEARIRVVEGFREQVRQFQQMPYETHVGMYNFVNALVLLYSGLSLVHLEMDSLERLRWSTDRSVAYSALLPANSSPLIARREALVLLACALCLRALRVMEEQDPSEELLLLLDDIFRSFRGRRDGDTAVRVFKSTQALEPFVMLYASQDMLEAAARMDLPHLIWGLCTVYNHGKTKGKLVLRAHQRALLEASESTLRYDPCDYCKRYFAVTSRCSACKTARYCSAEHQKKGWKRHKSICREVSECFNDEKMANLSH